MQFSRVVPKTRADAAPAPRRGLPLPPRPSRSAVTGALALAAQGLGVTAMASRLQGVRGALLTFHRAVPTAQWAALPNREFHLDAGFLDRLLRHLRHAGWDIVTVEEAQRRAAEGSDRPYVNFSVDDCYRDTAEVVVPLFRRHGVPVTLFVTTGIPDGTLCLWQAGLESILAESPVVRLEDDTSPRSLALTDAAMRRALFDRLQRQWEAAGPEACYAAFCRDNGYDAAALHRRHAIDWGMLQALRDDPCVEIGAHTVSHRRIAALPEDQAWQEIAGSRDRLRQQLGRPVRHFAFPFGRSGDCGPRDFALVRDAGFASASTTRKGLMPATAGQRPFVLPRNTVNGAHRRIAQVTFQLAGLSGLATRLAGGG